jgi:branched-chain amino acid transport system permease protein
VTGFLEHLVSGLASGGIYGLLALAIVLVRRTTGVINFAQGEMATLAAFGCWTLVDHGWAFWPAFGATIALSFAGGAALQIVVLRPVERGPLAGILVLTVGLLLSLNGLMAWIWGGAPKRFDGPFSASLVTVGGAAFSKRDIGVVVASLALAALVGLLLTRTKLGLGLRAASASPAEARLAGVRVGAMRAAGWGLAAALGAVAGVLAAPSLGLEPNMLQTALLYALAAAVLGGLDSPAGALVGGLLLGVLLDLVGSYVHWVGGELRPATALAVLLAVLLVRPAGPLAVRRA